MLGVSSGAKWGKFASGANAGGKLRRKSVYGQNLHPGQMRGEASDANLGTGQTQVQGERRGIPAENPGTG